MLPVRPEIDLNGCLASSDHCSRVTGSRTFSFPFQTIQLDYSSPPERETRESIFISIRNYTPQTEEKIAFLGSQRSKQESPIEKLRESKSGLWNGSKEEEEEKVKQTNLHSSFASKSGPADHELAVERMNL